jgi:hypothetical protein
MHLATTGEGLHALQEAKTAMPDARHAMGAETHTEDVREVQV